MDKDQTKKADQEQEPQSPPAPARQEHNDQVEEPLPSSLVKNANASGSGSMGIEGLD